MAYQRVRGASPAPANPSRLRPAAARRCLRLAAVGFAAGAVALLAAPDAAGAAHNGARERPWIAITSMKPGYEQPTGKVTVSGIVTNPGGSPLRNMSVQLWSSSVPLTGPEMDSYLTAAEPTGVDQQIAGAQRTLPARCPRTAPRVGR